MAPGGGADRHPGGDPQVLDQPGRAPSCYCKVGMARFHLILDAQEGVFGCWRVQRVPRTGVARLDTPAGGGRSYNKQLIAHVKWTEILQERRWDIKVFLDTGESTWVTRDGPEVTTLSLAGTQGPLVVGGTGYYRSHMEHHPLPRVNYDQGWWTQIAEALRTDREKIDPMNRAQVPVYNSYTHFNTLPTIR